ncbi:MAG: murein biosynthesis integral membrane protein MurJ [Anaerolineales bacterium]|nr:murein biosynthesis integral membrane protein MurJ [Anaerolineales bacterium]
MTIAQRQIARAAGIVMAAFVLSNLVGLLRQMLISRAFGAGAELDAFLNAQRLPDLLFSLVAGGALASTFIPTFTGLLTQDDRDGAWRLASGVLTLVFLALTAASALAALAAPLLVRTLLGPGFDPTQQALAAHLLRIQLLAPVIFAASGLLMGVLNAHQHFLLPALAPTMLWVGMIVGLVLWAPEHGIDGLAWGYVLGAALHLVVQLPGLRRLPGARYTPGLGLGNRHVRAVLRLMAPRLFGVAAVQLNFIVTAILASYMAAGSVSALTYAWQIFTMPQVIIAQAIAIAALPAFSAMAAQGGRGALRASLADTLRGILFLALPATAGLLLLGTPIIRMLYEGRSFDAASTRLVAWALSWYTLGLAGHSVVEIVSRAYYALHDTRTPVLVGIGAMLLNIALSLLLAPAFDALGWAPHGGLALANTTATSLEMAGLMWLMRRRLGGLALARVWPGLARAAAGSALMGAALALWLRVSAPLADAWPEYAAWIVGLGGAALGGAVYATAAFALRAPEVALVVSMLRRRGEGE